MSRSRNYDKEFSQNDRLKKENSQLKRELSKLRRVVSRLNLDVEQFRNLKELVDKQAKEAKNTVKSKRDWTCFECARGIMSIHIIQRRDGTFYLRKCSNPDCGHQTKLKRYNDDVEQSKPGGNSYDQANALLRVFLVWSFFGSQSCSTCL